MGYTSIGKIKKPDTRHRAEVSKQTGFPSPATHYMEPTIDLNKELVTSKDATFFVRIKGNAWSEHMILNNDVLIIDKAIKPSFDDLVLVVKDGGFDVLRIPFDISKEEFTVWGTITYIIHAAQ